MLTWIKLQVLLLDDDISIGLLLFSGRNPEKLPKTNTKHKSCVQKMLKQFLLLIWYKHVDYLFGLPQPARHLKFVYGKNMITHENDRENISFLHGITG